jgi:hypothetical protein
MGSLRSVLLLLTNWINPIKQASIMAEAELFTEFPENRERDMVEELSGIVLERMKKLYGKETIALRDTHAKSHGGVKASLEIFDFNENHLKDLIRVHSELSPEAVETLRFKIGLLQKQMTYPAWLRFANGRPDVTHDYVSDARSMSVKILGVDGERLVESHETRSQDLIVQNSEIFFIKSIRSYMGFFKANNQSVLRTVLWLVTHPQQLFALMHTIRRKPASLLTERYWSGSASSLGLPADFDTDIPGTIPVRYPIVVKYVFSPVEPFTGTLLPIPNRTQDSVRAAKKAAKTGVHDNHFREDLIQALRRPNASFTWDFQIQVQTKSSQSIDDVTDLWDEKEAPVFTVGRLSVGSQRVDTAERQTFIEGLQYAPWNGLALHRPVGALNRLRKYVYPIVRDFRQSKKGGPYIEPTGLEPF